MTLMAVMVLGDHDGADGGTETECKFPMAAGNQGKSLIRENPQT